MEWLCPPQPSSTPAHASGRDHFKADSGSEVEAGKQTVTENLIRSDNLQLVLSFRMLVIFSPPKAAAF